MIMELRMLGPVELWAEGQQYGLGPARQRCVLAILLLTPRTVVSAEALARKLWDERPPPKAREDLSAYVSGLRKSLRQVPGDHIRVISRAHGYMLDLDPEVVDLHRFSQLRRQAAAVSGSGDIEHAARLLRTADALWSGQALAGLPGRYLARMRDSLEEDRRAAIAERIGIELQLGQHSELLGELRDMVARYPLDEALIAHQMTALFRSGRPSDALEAFRETRSRLISDQGTEPGPALADLHQRILSHDPGLAAPQRPGIPVREPPPDTLPPADVGEFVGRDEEIRALTGEQASTPQIHIIEGMPGVGKTALAVHAARSASDRYPDGSLYLNLHAYDPGHAPLDPNDALDQMLRMLPVPAQRIPPSGPERAALWQAELGRRRVVVVLDDVVSPGQVRPLLPAEGRSLVLITSRRRLPGLAGAASLSLDVLPGPDAVALFSGIAGPARTDDQGAVTRAVQLCGYLPLAIRLAAGRLRRDHSPALAELVDELACSAIRPGTAGAASTQVMSAFELSYRGLSAGEQRFFRALAGSPCTDTTVHAAAALSGTAPARAQACLDALLDHHLLARTASGHFRFHELIRGFAADRARAEDPAPDQRQAVRRLLDYYLITADRADRALRPHTRRLAMPATRPSAVTIAVSTPEEAGKWLDAEWRSIEQAARYAAGHEWKQDCADLTHAIAGFLNTGAHWQEAVAAHTLALRACRELCDPPRTARALLDLGLVSQKTGHHDVALLQAEEAAAIYRSLADREGEAAAIDRIGTAHYYAGRFREALAHFAEASTLYQGTGDKDGLATALSHTGISCWYLGHYREAISSLEAELAIDRELADRRGEAGVLNNLADIQLRQGYHRDALRNYQAALAIFQEIGGPWNLAILHSNIGTIHHYKGSYEEALAEHRAALAIYRQSGDLRHQAGSLRDIGTAYQGMDLYGEALIHHQKALAIAAEIDDRYVHMIARRGIADAHRGGGQHGQAIDQYRAALALAREIGDLHEEAQILRGTAEAVIHTQGPSQARILLRQSLDILERLAEPDAEAVRTRIYALGHHPAAPAPGPGPLPQIAPASIQPAGETAQGDDRSDHDIRGLGAGGQGG